MGKMEKKMATQLHFLQLKPTVGRGFGDWLLNCG